MTDAHINRTMQYVQSLTPAAPAWTENLVHYAEQNRVPIIDEVSLHYLLQLVRMQNPQRILEIGTAIGYSALRMHHSVPNARIITIEKDEQMSNLAKENIKAYAQNEVIDIIHGDGLEQLQQLQAEAAEFDFVFIDAAKRQYEQYFTLVDSLVKVGGIIVSDNVLFRNYLANEVRQVPKRFKKIVTALQSFNKTIMNHEKYHSSIVPLGDGLLVSVKIK